jgi:hypothetical protein
MNGFLLRVKDGTNTNTQHAIFMLNHWLVCVSSSGLVDFCA